MSDSTSDSDAQMVDADGAKTRPKLRTRAAVQQPTAWYSETPTDGSDGDDVAEQAAMKRAVAASLAEAAAAARAKRKRQAEADEDFEVAEEELEEEDEDEDEDEDEEDGVEEEEEEEDDGRRRSGRARKVTTTYVSSDDFDFIESDDEVAVKPKRKRLSTATRKSSKGDKTRNKKQRRSRKASDEDSDDSDAAMLDDEVDLVSGDGDDDDDDYVAPASKSRAQAKRPRPQQQQPPSDDEDEKSFIIDKLLAREVHTRNEWAKMCANKKTRFLHNFSIFLPDENEEKAADEGAKEPSADAEEPTSAADPDVVIVDDSVEKFLVKWKNLSYLHTSWETEKDLLDVDKNAKGKLQRFREKEAFGFFTDSTNGDEYYNPEFRIVDRILDIQDRPGDDFAPADDDDGGDPDKHKLQYFLVKWKALPYDQTTWEREDDVCDDAAVAEYDKRLVRAAGRFHKAVADTKKAPRGRRFKVQHFHAYTARAPPPKKASQPFELRDYQLTGVNWMLFNWYQNRNSMLADEMGLGKTVQTVMYLNHLAQVEETPSPFLIMAPLSTLSHWQREFENWTDLNAVVYHGSANARSVLQSYEFFLSADELARADTIRGRKAPWGSKTPPRPKRDCFRFDVLITSYEMCSGNDHGALSRIPWQVMVVDEAHRLKNRTSKLSSMLHGKFKFDKILLLTGTPLQNNVEELWTLLNFLDGYRFRSKEAFLEQFGELKDSSQVEKLHAELKPFLLRRMKEDVEKSLAPKEETIIEVELTVLQKQYYRAIYEKNTEFLARGRKKGHAPSLMNIMMELRKCCNHAFLIKGAEEREIATLRQRMLQQAKDKEKEKSSERNGRVRIDQEAFEREAREMLVTSSGKLVLLDKLLPRLKENGHRVLIFSQFKIMLDIVQDYLKLRAYRCERIDGNITGNDRQSAIDRFCDPESAAFIMLLSTRAGGVGINLTAADTVIIYDSDWNPQNDLQAQARCHRIGQKKSVKIYRLLTPKTYELHMFHQASLKLGLDQAVLGGIRNANSSALASSSRGKGKASANARLSKEEIENLLKHGAYEMFKEEKEGEAEAASKRFSEESIDQILSRSTTIVHDPKKGADADKKSLMSSFSKATFVSSANPDEAVDIDDPDFWTKVVGLKAMEELERERAAAEALPLKRRRARVRSYAAEQMQFDDGMSDDGGVSFTATDGRVGKTPKSLEASVEVISDDDDYSDDDDDASDEDEDDEMVDDDFMILDKKKRRRSGGSDGVSKKQKADLPPLFLYKEYIFDMLFELGYGRWDELQRRNLGLRRYATRDVQRFTCELVASCVRLACAPSMASIAGVELTMQHIYGARAGPPPAAATAGAGAASSPVLQKLGRCLDDFAKRFKFLAQVVKDAGVARLSDIETPVDLRRNLPVPAKGDRQLVQKLNHIDRMWALATFVRIKLQTPKISVSAFAALLNDFQAVGSDSAVRELIDAGKLPPPRATPAKPARPPTAKPAPPLTAIGATGGAAASVSPELTPSAAVTPSAPATTSSAASITTTTSTSSTTPTKGEGSASPTAVAVAAQPDGPSPSSGEAKATVDAESTTESGKEEAAAASTEGQDAAELEEKAAAPAASTTDGDSASTPVKSAAASVSTPPGTPAPELTPKKVEQRQAAFKVLQSLMFLQSLGSPALVAPWWISVVDDLMLVLYVYRDGWMRSRNLPPKLASESSLFGSRAAAYSESLWPTVATLNRRVKSLLSLVASAAKSAVAKSAAKVAASAKAKAAAYASANGSSSTAKPASSSNMPSWIDKEMALRQEHARLPPLMDMVPHRQLQYNQQQQVYQQQLHQHQQHQDQRQSARPQVLGSKHNQFAKLVFSYGIPDMRTCRTPPERAEKWRYFLQDAQLGVAKVPLERLHAEARDLERVCRERVQLSDGASAAADSFLSPSKLGAGAIDASAAAPARVEHRTATESVFGGHRGYWMLSATQCHRLLHRVDLFRLLRTQILVLPPAQLVEVVGRVIKALQAKQAEPPYPAWWSSPRHDILLLQGVECYGLDDHLAQVWKLPLFAQATATRATAGSPFPNSVWVENYVSTLAAAARKLLDKARRYREEAKRRARAAPQASETVDMTAGDGDEGDDKGDARGEVQGDDADREAAQQKEREAKQRVRDIGDMRAEDPMSTLSVRLRQLLESNEANKAALRRTQEKQTSSLSSPSRRGTAAKSASSVESTTPPAESEEKKRTPVKKESEASPAAGKARAGGDRGGRSRRTSTSPVTATRSPSLRRRPPPPAERKRALRSFELIVIDDSDASDSD